MAEERYAEAFWIESRQYWQIKVQKNGVKRTFTDKTPGKKGKRALERKADAWRSGEAVEIKLRLDDAWARFLAYQNENTGTACYRKYESCGRIHLLPLLGKKYIADITPMDWQLCINKGAKDGLARRSCVNIRLAISCFVNFCKRNRWAVDTPLPRELTIPRNAPQKEKSILQPDGLRTLFTIDWILHYRRQVPSFYIHAWRFIVLTGLRRGELCGLKQADCDRLNRLLTVRRSINSLNEETGGKTINARRCMALSDHALKTLDDQHKMLEERGIQSEWLFPGEDGGCMDSNALYKHWLTYRTQHGIAVTLHELRHTFISIVKNDMPLAQLKATVGHSVSMDTLGVYGHLVSGEMIQGARSIDTAFDRFL